MTTCRLARLKTCCVGRFSAYVCVDNQTTSCNVNNPQAVSSCSGDRAPAKSDRCACLDRPGSSGCSWRSAHGLERHRRPCAQRGDRTRRDQNGLTQELCNRAHGCPPEVSWEDASIAKSDQLRPATTWCALRVSEQRRHQEIGKYRKPMSRPFLSALQFSCKVREQSALFSSGATPSQGTLLDLGEGVVHKKINRDTR